MRRIPGPLKLIHGEGPTAFDVILVYVVGIVFAILALVFAYSRVEALPPWKAALLFLVALDTSGGVAAGFTRSTDRYYAARPALRWVFIFAHFLEPAILSLLFDGRLAYWIFLYGYSVAAASLVNVMRDRARQEPAAAALLVVGIVLLLPIGAGTPFLAWFGPVYMLKLIAAFAVRRW